MFGRKKAAAYLNKFLLQKTDEKFGYSQQHYLKISILTSRSGRFSFLWYTSAWLIMQRYGRAHPNGQNILALFVARFW